MSMMDLVDEVSDEADRIVSNMESVQPYMLGLDPRCCSTLYVDDDCIVVDKRNDRLLQYYGGFEYVDKASRMELGDYVIYTVDDERVRECLECLAKDEEDLSEQVA